MRFYNLKEYGFQKEPFAVMNPSSVKNNVLGRESITGSFIDAKDPKLDYNLLMEAIFQRAQRSLIETTDLITHDYIE